MFYYIVILLGALLSLFVAAAHIGIVRVAFAVVALCIVWVAGWWAWIRPFQDIEKNDPTE